MKTPSLHDINRFMDVQIRNEPKEVRLLTGAAAPMAGQGRPGDMYFASVEKAFYGPKSEVGWGDPMPLGLPVSATLETGRGGEEKPRSETTEPNITSENEAGGSTPDGGQEGTAPAADGADASAPENQDAAIPLEADQSQDTDAADAAVQAGEPVQSDGQEATQAPTGAGNPAPKKGKKG